MSNQLQISGAAKIRSIQGPVVANSGVITALDGDASQYVRGDGTLADFPTSTGGGSSVSYYLNTSVSQGTIGGVAYKQLSKVPISGAGTDVTISANGYIASYLTDANDPALLEVPAGNFNCEFYFSVNSNAHNPYVYAEVYKYDGTTFTLLGSSVSVPEYLTNGTTLSPYYFAIPVATSVLTITDRIAIRIYVNVDGRTVTLHTENNHLCQVVTTFSKGLTTLNSLTRQVQFFQTGTSGTDFAISSSVATHTFNLPVASAANTGKLSSTDWSTFNGKVPYTGATTNVTLGAFNLTADNINLNSNLASLTRDAVNSIGILRLQKGANGYIQPTTLAVDRTYTLPDASGTIALTSNLSSYVPYTGATANVDLGLNNLTANNVFGETSLNVKVLPSGSVYSTGYATLSSLAGKFTMAQEATVGNLKAFTFDFSAWASNSSYTYTLPAASGTIALTSNLTAYLPLSGGTLSGLLNISTASYLTSRLKLINTATGGNSWSLSSGNANNSINDGLFTIINETLSKNIFVLGPTGKLDIGADLGTINPSFALSVYDTNPVLRVFDLAGNNSNINLQATNTEAYIRAGYATTAIPLIFQTGNTTRLTIAATGAATFAGNVNFSSTIGNGTFTYTLPSATGTLALGTGTTNYVSKFTGTSTIGNSLIFDNGTNVGIGNTNTSYTLDVSGTGRFTGNVNIDGERLTIGGTSNNAVINNIASVRINIDCDNNDTAESFTIGKNQVSIDNNNVLFRVQENGNVGIGTISPSAKFAISNAGAEGLEFIPADSSNYNRIQSYSRSGGVYNTLETRASTHIWAIDATERMRITNGGYTKISNTGTYEYPTAGVHEIRQSAADFILYATNPNASPNGHYVSYTTASPNGTSNNFIICADSSTTRFRVASNGGIYNYIGNNVPLSDKRMKKEIAALESYWDKFKSIEMVKFKYIDQIHDDFNIGVVSQQIESIMPEFVDVWDEENIPEDGKPLMGVYMEDIHNIAMKVLQEAMTKIEELQARLDNAGL